MKSTRNRKFGLLVAAGLLSMSILSACGSGSAAQPAATVAGGTPGAIAPEVQPPANVNELKGLSGQILIDGSSTVYPVTAAAAEEFNKYAPNVRIPVGVSGTGGGFKKFCAGESDIQDASRPISPSEV